MRTVRHRGHRKGTPSTPVAPAIVFPFLFLSAGALAPLPEPPIPGEAGCCESNAWAFGCGQGTFWRQEVDQNGSQDGDCGSKVLSCHHEQEVRVYALSGYWLSYNSGCIPPGNHYTVAPAPATTGYPDDDSCGDTWLDPTGDGYATVHDVTGCGEQGKLDCDGNRVSQTQNPPAKIYVLLECNPCNGSECSGGGGGK